MLGPRHILSLQFRLARPLESVMTVEVKVIAEKLVCPLLRVWKRGQCDTIVLEQDEVGSKQSRWGERKEKKKKNRRSVLVMELIQN